MLEIVRLEFTTKLKCAVDSLLKWFNAKFKLTNLELSNSTKRKYEIGNPIDWLHDHAVFAHPLSKFMLPNLMLIAKQCLMSILSFSRSISFWEIYFWARSSPQLIVWKIRKPIIRRLSNFLKLYFFLQNSLNTHEEFGECFDEDLLNFYHNNCAMFWFWRAEKNGWICWSQKQSGI